MNATPSSCPPLAWPPALPLVAILRGLQPERAADVATVLFDAGWRVLEVPLNRPGALACIETIARLAPPDAVIGAGTVTEPAQVSAVARAGGTLVVSPHTDERVIAAAVAQQVRAVPGVFTPTEAFAALRAGAAALKLFPAEAMSPAGLKALRTVLPEGTPLWPVGGIEPHQLATWCAHGASGFGIGGALFQPAFELGEIARRARSFVEAWPGA